MDWFVKAFIKASVAWLTVGVTIGVAMGAYPAWTVYRLAHMHTVLLGFVTMMIYGVAYHVIPRFAGFPLYSRRAATYHWWLSNIGLLVLASGFIVRVRNPALGTPMVALGGGLSAIGAYTFAYVLWRTMDGHARLVGLQRAQ
jgi:cbb3-type cytochrome oxidase subunit 1